MTYTLHTAQKAYSSWSLRGWLLLEAFDLPFEERLWRLYSPEMEVFRDHAAPAMTVPALEWREWDDRRVLVWESLAIAETLAERHPERGHWPADPAARAEARALAAEMHAGFSALRRECPMNTHRRDRPVALTDAARADVARLAALWSRALAKSKGPWLFGDRFGAVDAFFAPIAYRARGYALPFESSAAEYVAALLTHPAMRKWEADAAADPERIARYEDV